MKNMAARCVKAPFRTWTGHCFRRNYQLVAASVFGKQSAENLFGRAIGINVSGINESSAGANEGIDLVPGLMFVGIPTPSHRPKR